MIPIKQQLHKNDESTLFILNIVNETPKFRVKIFGTYSSDRGIKSTKKVIGSAIKS